MARTGRPSSYSPAIAEEICLRLETGESMVRVCRDESMPGLATVYAWLERHPDFQDRYARARERQADTVAATAIEEAITATDAQLGRLAYDARRWYAGKLSPKKYGDKVQNEVTGSNGGAVTLQIVTGVPRGNGGD